MTNKRQVQNAQVKALIDEAIDRHAEAYIEAYNGQVREFNNFERSGTSGYYIGMVWTEDFEKPDPQQLKIVGSKSLTRNKMVEIDLSLVDQLHSFFPGQIIALEAGPFISRRLSARRILDPIKIAPPLKNINTDSNLKLMIACGPFLKPDQEDLDLFIKIVESVKINEATHLILIGPFVDLDNKLARSSYDTCWKSIFDQLAEGLNDIACEVYLVPSARDIMTSELNSNFFYPTPDFKLTHNLKDGVKLKCKLHPVTDPSQIDVGGLFVDVTSAEVLLHLNRTTSFINKGQCSVFDSLYKSIVTHGIYPIYPSPNDVAIDYVKLNRFLKLDRLSPHIIVLPTRFTQSVANCEERVIVTIQKCSIKRQVILLEIPKTESSQQDPKKSIWQTEFKHKIIDL